MRYSLVRRASARALALATAALAIGCGPGSTGTTGNTTSSGGTGGEGTTMTAPETPVSSCTLADDVTLGAGEDSAPAIAYGGGRFAIAYSDPARGAGDIVLAIVDADEHTVHEQAIAAGPAAAVAPSVAALPGGGFIVTWADVNGAAGTVRAQRVGADGAPAGSAITLTTTGSREAHPEAAASANGALIAWTEATGAVVAEIRNDAVAGKMALPGAAQAAVSAGDHAPAAVWIAGPQVGFARVPAPIGAVAAAANPVMLRAASGRANVPRLAAGPSGSYAVVWEDARTESEAIYLAAVGTDGRPAAEIQVSPGGGSANTPDVAFLGGRAAVVYYQFRGGPSQVYLSLIDPARGRVGEEVRLSDHGGARFPRIAWGGGGTLGVAYAQRGGPVRLAMITCR